MSNSVFIFFSDLEKGLRILFHIITTKEVFANFIDQKDYNLISIKYILAKDTKKRQKGEI